MVWASSPEADLIKGKFLWANWDVNELKELLKQKAEEKFLLTIEVRGMPNLSF
jgi:hypothetical protein